MFVGQYRRNSWRGDNLARTSMFQREAPQIGTKLGQDLRKHAVMLAFGGKAGKMSRSSRM